MLKNLLLIIGLAFFFLSCHTNRDSEVLPTAIDKAPDKEKVDLSDAAKIKQIAVGRAIACALSDKVTCWGWYDHVPKGISEIKNPINIQIITANEKYSMYGNESVCITAESGARCWKYIDDNEHYGPEFLALPKEVTSAKKIKWLPFYRSDYRYDLDICALMPDRIRCWTSKTVSFWPTDFLGEYDDFAMNYANVCGIKKNKIECFSLYDLKNTNHEFIGLPDVLKNPRGIQLTNYYDNRLCVITDDGAECWGDEQENKDWNNLFIREKIKNPQQIVLGERHTCVLGEEGIKCWFRDIDERFYTPKILKNPRMFATHDFILGFEVACAVGDEGVECWKGREPYFKEEPESVIVEMPYEIAAQDGKMPTPIYCAGAAKAEDCHDFSGTYFDAAENPNGVGVFSIKQNQCESLGEVLISAKDVYIPEVPLNGAVVPLEVVNNKRQYAAACTSGSDLLIEVFRDGAVYLYQHAGDRVCMRKYSGGADMFLGCTFITEK